MAHWVFLVVSSQNSSLPSGNRPQVLKIPLLALSLPLPHSFPQDCYQKDLSPRPSSFLFSQPLDPPGCTYFQDNLSISPSLLSPRGTCPSKHLPTKRGTHPPFPWSLLGLLIHASGIHYKSKAANLGQENPPSSSLPCLLHTQLFQTSAFSSSPPQPRTRLPLRAQFPPLYHPHDALPSTVPLSDRSFSSE